MKYIIVSALFISLMGTAAPAFAQTATSTPMVGSRHHAYIAGFVDSIHGKGAWLLANVPLIGRIYYTSENPEQDAKWKEIIGLMNYR